MGQCLRPMTSPSSARRASRTPPFVPSVAVARRQCAPRTRSSAWAWFYYIYRAPTLNVSHARINEMTAVLPGLSSAWIANLHATLKFYADTARCDRFNLDIVTTSIAESLNGTIKKDTRLNKLPAHAIPGAIADALTRVEDNRATRRVVQRDARNDDPVSKESRDLASMLHRTTTPEHFAAASLQFSLAQCYAVFPLTDLSAGQQARLASTASGTKFLAAMRARREPGSRTLIGCSLPGAIPALRGDGAGGGGDEEDNALVHHHVIVVDAKDGWVMCSCFHLLRCGTWCKHLWAAWIHGHI